MKSVWCSEAGGWPTLRLACFLISLTLPVSPAWSHADILLQIEGLDSQLQQQPNNAELLIQRGDLYRRHGDYLAAAADFKTARAAQADVALLDFYEGRLLLETGDAAGAEQRLDRHLLSHPENANARILRAEIRLALDRAEEAAQDYALAIQFAEQPSPALFRDWSLALVRAGEDQWGSARSVVDIGLERYSQDVSLLALGTDIALAENLPERAELYIARLSPPILQLSRWQDRLQTMHCLAATKEINAPQGCLDAARSRLIAEVRLPGS